jgi:hypothetical protein
LENYVIDGRGVGQTSAERKEKTKKEQTPGRWQRPPQDSRNRCHRAALMNTSFRAPSSEFRADVGSRLNDFGLGVVFWRSNLLSFRYSRRRPNSKLDSLPDRQNNFQTEQAIGISHDDFVGSGASIARLSPPGSIPLSSAICG